jgi:hypothetical protein
MTRATEYRQFAQECIKSARAATSDVVREQFLDIAKLWMMAASHLDSAGVNLGRLDGHAPPKVDGMAPHGSS